MKPSFRFTIPLLLAMACLLACTKDDTGDGFIQDPESLLPPSQEVHLTAFSATLAARSEGKSWPLNGLLSLQYQKSDGDFERALATIESVESDGSAKISAILLDAKDGGTLKFVYPASLANSSGDDIDADRLSEQLGTLEDIAKRFDAATGSVTLSTKAGEDGSPLKLEDRVSISKFTPAVDGTPIEGILSLRVSDGTHCYTAAPAEGCFGTDGIYLAMLPVSGLALNCTATTATKTYVFLSDKLTLQVGFLYDELSIVLHNPVGIPGTTPVIPPEDPATPPAPETPPADSGTPPTSDTPPADSGTPPTSDTPPADSGTPPTSDTPPADSGTPPTSDTPPADSGTPPTSDTPPADSGTPPTSDTPPADSGTPPTSDTPPADSGTPPTSDTPPADSGTPPTSDTPPADSGTPPTSDTPPADSGTPPTSDTPPADSGTPPTSDTPPADSGTPPESETPPTTTPATPPAPETPPVTTLQFSSTLASKGGQPQTKSVESDGTTKWNTGEQLKLYYETNNGFLFATAEVSAVADDGSATFTASLDADAKDGGTVKFVYPATLAGSTGELDPSKLASQHGTIEDISARFDAATGTSTLIVNGETCTTARVSMKNRVLIGKYTPMYNNAAIEGITSLTISDGTHIYTVTPSSGTFGTDGIYVAMLPVDAVQISIVVITGTGSTSQSYCYKSSKPITLSAGKLYTNLAVPMVAGEVSRAGYGGYNID